MATVEADTDFEAASRALKDSYLDGYVIDRREETKNGVPIQIAAQAAINSTNRHAFNCFRSLFSLMNQFRIELWNPSRAKELQEHFHILSTTDNPQRVQTVWEKINRMRSEALRHSVLIAGLGEGLGQLGGFLCEYFEQCCNSGVHYHWDCISCETFQSFVAGTIGAAMTLLFRAYVSFPDFKKELEPILREMWNSLELQKLLQYEFFAPLLNSTSLKRMADDLTVVLMIFTLVFGIAQGATFVMGTASIYKSIVSVIAAGCGGSLINSVEIVAKRRNKLVLTVAWEMVRDVTWDTACMLHYQLFGPTAANGTYEVPAGIQVSANMECSICMNLMYDPVTLNGHLFCNQCIRQHLQVSTRHPQTGMFVTVNEINPRPDFRALIDKFVAANPGVNFVPTP